MQSYVLLTYSATIFLYFYELFRLSLAACGICRLFFCGRLSLFLLIFLQRSVAIVLIIKWPDNDISEHSVRNVSCSRLTKKRALALKPEEPLFFAIRRRSLRVARRFQ